MEIHLCSSLTVEILPGGEDVHDGDDQRPAHRDPTRTGWQRRTR